MSLARPLAGDTASPPPPAPSTATFMRLTLFARASPASSTATFSRTGALHSNLWVPKTCATWPDAPLTAGFSARRLPGRGMIFGLWA